VRTYEDDLGDIDNALFRIRYALAAGLAITPAEAAQLQVAAEDLSTCADWMEAG
jgi:hypothetical protein